MNSDTRMMLLSSIIEQLQEPTAARPAKPGCNYTAVPLIHVYAHFLTRRGRDFANLSVTQAMDCLMNDVYTFEDFTLEDAHGVRLEIH